MKILATIPNDIFEKIRRRKSIDAKESTTLLNAIRNGLLMPTIHPEYKKTLKVLFLEEMGEDLLNDFVNFLTSELCEDCKECEPRLSPEWMPKGLACKTEGEVKWLISKKDEFIIMRGK